MNKRLRLLVLLSATLMCVALILSVMLLVIDSTHIMYLTHAIAFGAISFSICVFIFTLFTCLSLQSDFGVVSGYLGDTREVLSEYDQKISDRMNSLVDVRTILPDSSIDSLIEELHEAASQVKSLCAEIDNMQSYANDAHVLSLNAALEAARSGGSSSAFSHIAEELRSLSKAEQKSLDESKQQAQKVIAVIESSLQRENDLREALIALKENLQSHSQFLAGGSESQRKCLDRLEKVISSISA